MQNYVYHNAKLYEQETRKGVYNCGHMKCSLMIYYLKQDHDFYTWYKGAVEKLF
jgi:hypothetical protein